MLFVTTGQVSDDISARALLGGLLQADGLLGCLATQAITPTGPETR